MVRTENAGLPERRALASLAAHFGIEPGFRDARGKDVVTSPETQKRLLAAMGVEADSEPKAAISANPAQSAEALTPLPPVLVVRSADRGCSVEIALPRDVRRIAWRIELEDGSERSGLADVPSHAPASSGRAQSKLLLESGELPWGYHRMHLPESGATGTLIVTPGKCWLALAFDEGAGFWGVASSSRSRRNAGAM
jgi:4-alpha-glucanotransferase